MNWSTRICISGVTEDTTAEECVAIIEDTEVIQAYVKGQAAEKN